mgnify:CR=1 FL=1
MEILEDLEIAITAHVDNCMPRLEKMGYEEDNIVAIEFEDDYILFFMTDGEEIKIKPKMLWIK